MESLPIFSGKTKDNLRVIFDSRAGFEGSIARRFRPAQTRPVKLPWEDGPWHDSQPEAALSDFRETGECPPEQSSTSSDPLEHFFYIRRRRQPGKFRTPGSKEFVE